MFRTLTIKLIVFYNLFLIFFLNNSSILESRATRIMEFYKFGQSFLNSIMHSEN